MLRRDRRWIFLVTARDLFTDWGPVGHNHAVFLVNILLLGLGCSEVLFVANMLFAYPKLNVRPWPSHDYNAPVDDPTCDTERAD